jgi:hypothetical protein
MKAWAIEQLHTIIEADNLHVAPLRNDGKTTGTPTWIWCVEVDGDLYVRAYNGTRSSWYQSAIKQRTGQIVAAGNTTEVSFEAVSGPINDRIDAAYTVKYRGSRYLSPMISEQARSATVKISPNTEASSSS